MSRLHSTVIRGLEIFIVKSERLSDLTKKILIWLIRNSSNLAYPTGTVAVTPADIAKIRTIIAELRTFCECPGQPCEPLCLNHALEMSGSDMRVYFSDEDPQDTGIRFHVLSANTAYNLIPPQWAEIERVDLNIPVLMKKH